jgi:hypothetical protein
MLASLTSWWTIPYKGAMQGLLSKQGGDGASPWQTMPIKMQTTIWVLSDNAKHA